MAVRGSLVSALKRSVSLGNITFSSLAKRAVSTGAFQSDHTSKWMQGLNRKSPMQLINEVPPIKVDKRVIACRGGTEVALGHPVEFICVDSPDPSVCKYCGLRYYMDHHH